MLNELNTMNIPLTDEQKHAVRQLIEAGIFTSEEEAIAVSHEWLRQEAKKLEELRRDIQEASDDRDHGDMVDGDELFRKLKERQESEFGPVKWRA